MAPFFWHFGKSPNQERKTDRSHGWCLSFFWIHILCCSIKKGESKMSTALYEEDSSLGEQACFLYTRILIHSRLSRVPEDRQESC
jgi:hypothetical protein